MERGSCEIVEFVGWRITGFVIRTQNDWHDSWSSHVYVRHCVDLLSQNAFNR